MSSAATSRPTTTKLHDLDITIISAKNLKNVNWRNGDLKPYVIFWVDPDRRQATKSDDSGSTRPVWNERFLLPVGNFPPQDSLLTLEIFHSKPSETPKPLVGSIRIPLKDISDPDDSSAIRTYEVRRPSGRPQGKIRLKLAIRERPQVHDYQIAPPSSYYYSSAPPPPPARYSPSPYTSLSTSMPPPPPLSPSPPPPSQHSYQYSAYTDPYAGYYPGYYSHAPPPPPRPSFERQMSYSSGGGSGQVTYGGGPPGPSAPVDYTTVYEQKQQRTVGGRMGMGMGLGTGLAVGTVAGALGGLALDEGLKYEEERVSERVESDVSAAAARDDYREYRVDY